MQTKIIVFNVFLAVYLLFFSLPILSVWYSPMWGVSYYYFNSVATFLRIIGFLSPWAFLVVGIVCCKKGLRLQTYITTALFFWAVILQVSLILFYNMEQTFFYYRRSMQPHFS